MATIEGNENNPATLKLVLADKLAKTQYAVNIRGHNGK